MENRMAEFYKVSFEQFSQDYLKTFGEASAEEINEIYNGIVLPKRATSGSAGYDIFSTADFTLKPNETVTIPTGIRVKMENNWVFAVFPRSGLGFKYRLQLNNTVGIIDSDYYFSSNEGHIFIKLTNASNENKILTVEKGNGIAQGIFLPFGITVSDACTEKRDGGFGSTGK